MFNGSPFYLQHGYLFRVTHTGFCSATTTEMFSILTFGPVLVQLKIWASILFSIFWKPKGAPQNSLIPRLIGEMWMSQRTWLAEWWNTETPDITKVLIWWKVQEHNSHSHAHRQRLSLGDAVEVATPDVRRGLIGCIKSQWKGLILRCWVYRDSELQWTRRPCHGATTHSRGRRGKIPQNSSFNPLICSSLGFRPSWTITIATLLGGRLPGTRCPTVRLYDCKKPIWWIRGDKIPVGSPSLKFLTLRILQGGAITSGLSFGGSESMSYFAWVFFFFGWSTFIYVESFWFICSWLRLLLIVWCGACLPASMAPPPPHQATLNLDEEHGLHWMKF